MFTRRNLKLAVLFVSLLTTGYFLVAQITRAQPNGGAGGTPVRDLGKSPPQVDELKATVLKKRTAAGNVLLAVRFAKGEDLPRRVDIRLVEKPVTFNDEGTSGDERAGDGVYSAITAINIDELQKDRQRIANIKAGVVPVFQGRELVNLKRINRELELRKFIPGVSFDIFPAGDPDKIDVNRSLMVTDPSVVQDRDRTRWRCNDRSMGKWSFGYLMQQMANQPVTGIRPEDFVLAWLNRWKTEQTVNSFIVQPRPEIVSRVIAKWPKNRDGSLDLSKAPFRLLAIVNRADLRGSFSYGGGSNDNGGELRFVFALVDPADDCSAKQFTVIFEYGVKQNSCAEMKTWALRWKNLDLMDLGSAEYKKALEKITELIVKSNANPGKPNGSALNQLRTNEVTLAGVWQLREFQIRSATNKTLEQVTVKQTPNIGFDEKPALGDYVNTNINAVLLDRHTVPLTFGTPSAPFLGGEAPVPGVVKFIWTFPPISNPNFKEARHHFSLQTCNGCHVGETKTVFTHVEVAGFNGRAANLSRFLRGVTPNTNDDEVFSMPDPENGNVAHEFNDLRRRATDLDALINTPCFQHFAIKPVLMVH